MVGSFQVEVVLYLDVRRRLDRMCGRKNFLAVGVRFLQDAWANLAHYGPGRNGGPGMASFRTETIIDLPAARAWARLSELHETHRLFPGVLTACVLDGNVRTVTFADGTVVKERIVTVDGDAMRLAYTVLERFEHHASSMEIVPVNHGQCRFVWISDVLPDAAIGRVAGLMTKGAAALRTALDIPPS
jgi:hypothetical protein